MPTRAISPRSLPRCPMRCGARFATSLATWTCAGRGPRRIWICATLDSVPRSRTLPRRCTVSPRMSSKAKTSGNTVEHAGSLGPGSGRWPSSLWSAVVFGAFAVVQRNRARTATAEAVLQRDRAEHEVLVAESQALLGSNRQLATLLALEADHRQPGADTRDALMNAVLAEPLLQRTFATTAPVGDMAALAVHRVAILSNNRGTKLNRNVLQVWDWQTGRRLTWADAPLGDNATGPQDISATAERAGRRGHYPRRHDPALLGPHARSRGSALPQWTREVPQLRVRFDQPQWRIPRRLGRRTGVGRAVCGPVGQRLFPGRRPLGTGPVPRRHSHPSQHCCVQFGRERDRDRFPDPDRQRSRRQRRCQRPDSVQLRSRSHNWDRARLDTSPRRRGPRVRRCERRGELRPR